MPLVTRFDTPAGIRDLPEGSSFYDAWHEEVRRIVVPEPGPVPEPGASAWIDPLTEDVDVVATRSLSWIAFPRKILPARRRDDRATAFDEAEANRNPDQDEYFEWFATERDGKITKVVFVTETPEYWRLLARTSRRRLLELYRCLVSCEVQEADLFEEVETPEGGRESRYNDFNRWNTTDGIVHYIVGINNITAAVGLAQQGAQNTAPVDAYADTLFNRDTSVDNYIPRDVGALVRNGHRVAVHDPVGLYIDGWDDTGFSKPDGTPVGSYWRVTRGRPGAALRVEYEVPQDVEEREGFVVGDILIGGRPITHGGQIAEHMTASLPIVVAKAAS